MFKNGFFSILCLMLASPMIQAKEIVSSAGGSGPVVRTSNNADGTLRFELCESRDASSCDALGRQEGYSLDELRGLRRYAILRGIGVTVLDIALIGVSAVGLTYAAGAAGAYAASAMKVSENVGFPIRVTGATFGLVSGTVAAGYGIRSVEILNPVPHIKNFKVLNEEILGAGTAEDEIVAVDDIEDFISRLSSLLESVPNTTEATVSTTAQP